MEYSRFKVEIQLPYTIDEEETWRDVADRMAHATLKSKARNGAKGLTTEQKEGIVNGALMTAISVGELSAMKNNQFKPISEQWLEARPGRKVAIEIQVDW